MSAPRTRWQQALDLLRAARDVAAGKGKSAKAAREQAAIDAVKHIPAPKPPPPPPVFPAVRAAREQSANGPQHGEGQCLLAVQECYGIPARDPSAAAAWAAANHKHPTADPASIPRGYPVWWTGGSHGFGHVAIAAGGGQVWSTDIRRVGFFDLVPITEIQAVWGLTLRGWSEDLEGVMVVASE